MRRGPARVALLAVGVIVLALLVARAAAADPTPPSSPSQSAELQSSAAPRPWLAQPPAANATGHASSRAGIRAGIALLLVSAMGGLALYLRYARRRVLGARVDARLRVIDSARVGPKAHLVLASVGGKCILLGVTDHAVRRLAWLPEERFAQPHAAAPIAVPPPDKGFGEMLKGLLRPDAARVPAPAQATTPSAALLAAASETRDVVERFGGGGERGARETAARGVAPRAGAERPRPRMNSSLSFEEHAAAERPRPRMSSSLSLEEQVAGLTRRSGRER